MTAPRIFLILCLLAHLPSAAQAIRARPNVLVLFTDDQRADTLAAWGNRTLRTPNLDRLARSGVSFNRAYMQGGMHGATCIPSRAMLLSGRGLYRIDEKLLRDPTWPAAFGEAGYTTFISGKWHNGEASVGRSFQEGRALFLGGMTDPLKANLSDLVDGKITPPVRAPRHACEIFADQAVAFLKQARERPFLCYVAFDGPHDPHIVPDDFPIRYNPNQVPLPPNFMEQHPWDNGEMKVRDEVLLPVPRDPAQIRAMIADYYRYISYLDLQIGRILQALQESPHARNTIVVFCADSGVARGSHGLIGKQNLYEHSVRVPLIIAGPGIPRGASTDALCYLYDVLPTVGKLCGVPAPSTSEGVDLRAVLKEPVKQGRSELIFAYREVQRAIRNERWKLIEYPKVGKRQLFDLLNDPNEINDLSADRAQSTRVSRMSGRLAELLEKAR